MHPALSSFLFVLSGFALLALFPIFAVLGFALGGGAGFVVGLVAAFFIMVWAACWAISS